MLNGVRSVASRARLSTAKNPEYVRRMYESGIDDRARPRCWRDTVRLQSDGRTSQPFRTAASNEFVRMFLPNSVLDITPQRSPPSPRASCRDGLRRSQSGAKFWLASIQARETPAGPK